MELLRFALTTIVTLTLVGCAENVAQPQPTAPTPFVATIPDPPVATAPDPPTVPRPPAVPRELTFVWVVVLGSDSGVCVPSATVEIVRGQGLGRRLTQSTRYCDIWEPWSDVEFRDLNVGEELTLRASAVGYAAEEKNVVPTSGGQFAVPIVLSRMQ